MKDLINAPPAFPSDTRQRVVFVDFTKAHYHLEFDVKAGTAIAVSHIDFVADSSGLAAISLNQPYLWAKLDGQDVHLIDQDSPRRQASFRVLSKPISQGNHTLTIRSTIERLGPKKNVPVNWLSNPDRLDCIFSMSDIRRDGGFLEAYLPSNYEYDHFEILMSVAIRHSTVDHTVFTNGTATVVGPGQWEIAFPEYFTTSCPWFHLGPTDDYAHRKDTFDSSDGRSVPILVYTRSTLQASGVDLDSFLRHAKCVLEELETDYGPFPHDTVTVLATGMGIGGMEYAGATATRLGSLRHELNHSYFARSIMPTNGNAGWMDEAIASWADEFYPSQSNPTIGPREYGSAFRLYEKDPSCRIYRRPRLFGAP